VAIATGLPRRSDPVIHTRKVRPSTDPPSQGIAPQSTMVSAATPPQRQLVPGQDGTRYTRRRGSGVPRRPARIGGDMHPVEQQSRPSMVVRRDHPNCNNKNSSVGHLTRPPVVARSTAAADTDRPAPTCGGTGRVIADQSLARKAGTIGSTRCAWRAVAPGQSGQRRTFAQDGPAGLRAGGRDGVSDLGGGEQPTAEASAASTSGSPSARTRNVA
jgi:hypothetical protein